MTAIIGLRSVNRIVLAADTQISQEGRHKFYESKILGTSGQGWCVALAYCDFPPAAKEAEEKIREALASKDDENITLSLIHDAIKGAFVSMSQTHYPMDLGMLIGASTVSEKPKLWVFDHNSFHEARQDFAVQGIGDSSLLRYISLALDHPMPLSSGMQENLAIYLIEKAKEYVDGCGGDTEVLVIEKGGSFKWLSGQTIQERARQMAAREQNSLRTIIDI